MYESAVDEDGLLNATSIFQDYAMAGASLQRNRSLSLSLPWRRPKSSTSTRDEMRDLPQQLFDVAIDDESHGAQDQFRPRGLSSGHLPHHPGRVKGIFRRASMSLRGMVHRRPSVAPEEAIYEEEPPWWRPNTSHLPSTSSGIRQSRSFYGVDFTQEPLPMSDRPIYTSHIARPGLGNEPPVIPHNSGFAAKASAALQNEQLSRQASMGNLQSALQSSLQNRWLNTNSGDDIGNDRESGIGIAVTLPGSQDAHISRIDFIHELPTELAIHILANLDALALSKACLVSREWNKVVNNQHIWRESCLRETSASYATSGPVQPNMGLGVPQVLPSSDWKQIYRVKKELEQRWKSGKARPVYLHGHTDSIYCLQFDEYVQRFKPPPIGLISRN
jgi:F-box and WD-40 domain protein 1/11